MSWVQFAAITCAVVALAPAGLAQTPDAKCRDAEFDSHSVVLDDVAPFAGASRKAFFFASTAGGNCRVVAFYRLAPKLPPTSSAREFRQHQAEYRDKTATPMFAARYIDDSRKANFKPRWTDEKRCPALVPAIQKVEPILAPKLTGDGPYRDTLGSVTDQPVYRFWLAGPVYPQRDQDYTFDLSIESGGQDAFGRWLNETLAALEPCWSTDPPVLE